MSSSGLDPDCAGSTTTEQVPGLVSSTSVMPSTRPASFASRTPMMEPSGSTGLIVPRPMATDFCTPSWSLPLTYTRQSPADVPLTQPSPVTATTRMPWSPGLGRVFGSGEPSCQVITSPSSVAHAIAVRASFSARPDEFGYGPKVRPPASTTTPSSGIQRTEASAVEASREHRR